MSATLVTLQILPAEPSDDIQETCWRAFLLLYVKSHRHLIWKWLETIGPIKVACNTVAKLKQRTVPILQSYPDMFSVIFLSCKLSARMFLKDRIQPAPPPSAKSASVTVHVWLRCSRFKPRQTWNQRSSLLKNILPFVAEVISVTTLRVSAKMGDPLASAQSVLQVGLLFHSPLMCVILRDGQVSLFGWFVSHVAITRNSFAQPHLVFLHKYVVANVKWLCWRNKFIMRRTDIEACFDLRDFDILFLCHIILDDPCLSFCNCPNSFVEQSE